MSGGKGGGAPSAPDYEALAQQQAQAQKDLLDQQTQANRPNQVTPWGNVTWTNDRQFNQQAYDQAMQAYMQQQNASANAGGQGYWDTNHSDGDNGSSPVWRPMPQNGQPNGSSLGGINGSGGASGGMVAPNMNDFYTPGGNWTQTVTLSPEQQALFDQQNKIQQGMFGSQNAALDRVNGMYANGFNPNTPQIYDPNLATNNATDLIMQRLNPQLDKQYESLQARLANQGIAQGSEAWRNALQQFDQGRNDAYNQASLAGINLGMAQQGMMNSQQQQAFQNDAYMRQLPLQELNALMGGTQVSMPQMPGYAQAGLAQAPDMMGAANASYNAALNAYNADQASNSSMLGGIAQIGGLALSGGLGGLFGGASGGITAGSGFLGGGTALNGIPGLWG